MKNILLFLIPLLTVFIQLHLFPQVTDIQHIPSQNHNQSITESTPAVISDDEILVFYASEDKDTVYSTRTTDNGVTWQESQYVISGYDSLNFSNKPIYISSLITSSGRIILSVVKWRRGILLIYSDDGGYSWSDAQLILGGGGNFPLQRSSLNNVNISELNNGKIILSFNTESGSRSYYRESLNEGQTWSEEAFVFYESANSTNGFRDISMISFSTNEVIAFFENNDGVDTGVYKRISSDGGNTWSDTIRVLNGPLKETHPRIIKDDSGNLWLFYLIENESGYSNYRQNDVYILKSTDGGLTWIENQRFTKYVGDDNNIRICNYNNNIFLSFATERFTNEYQIAYAIPGETEEISTPPKIIESTGGYLPSQSPFILRATVVDDEEVSSVKVFFDGSPDAEELFDDGNHNDLDSGDAVYGNEFPFSQVPGYTNSYLMNVNKIEMPMNNVGTLAAVSVSVNRELLFEATDINDFQSIKLSEINYSYGTLGKYDEIGFLFSSGFGLSGYNHEGLWANAQMSASLIENYTPGRVGADPEDPQNVIYVVRSSDPPFGDSWQRWNDAVLLGADFYDGDKDGIYNPVDKNWNGIWDLTEDMPDLLADETAWCVFNDGQPAELRLRFAGIPPQGIEIQQTIFASSLPELEDIIFIRYKITNKGTVAEVLDSVIFGFMSDPDLGDFMDDLVGCDTLLSSGFCYNDGEDELYGINPPAFYTTLLQGPIVECQNPSDIAYDRKGILIGANEFAGYKNQDIISSVNFVSSDPILGDPNDHYEIRYYMKGLTKIGNKLDPCNHYWGEVRGGEDCSKVNPLYWYSGDPVEDIGWISVGATDKRAMLSVGEFTLEKDRPVTIIGAYVLGRGTNALNSITVARENVRRAVLEYESNFASLTYEPGESTNPITDYNLYHNYPNPFNPTTTIRYEIPQDGIVTIKLYDILGQEVTTILNEFKKANRYEVKFNSLSASGGQGLASGVYIYRMKVNDFIESKKMILLR